MGLGFIGDIFGTVICRPLGYILAMCYRLGHDYGVALILFTLITRVFLFPLAVKQQRSSAEMLRMKPKMDELQKKYAKDKNKLNEEMMKLYQEEGYNPMGGCLPLLIQMPILFGLFTVVYQPLTYIVGLSTATVTKVVNALSPYMANVKDTSKREIYAAQVMSQHMDKLPFLPASTLKLKLDFFGFDLATVPKLEWSLLLFIPALCYISSLLSSYLNIKLNPAGAAQTGATGKSMNFSMIFLMPLMSTWFCFQVPAGVGFYWICTNLFMILQVLALRKFFNPERLAAEAEQKAQLRREARVRQTVSLPEEPEKEPEEEAVQPAAQKPKTGGAGAKPGQGASSPKRPNAPRKKKSSQSKSAIKEQNRRLLAASREREKGNGQNNAK